MVSILEIREEEFKKGLEVGVDISRDAFSREPWETMGWPGLPRLCILGSRYNDGMRG